MLARLERQQRASERDTCTSTEAPFKQRSVQLKTVKANRRSCLGEDRLEYLIRIQLEGPPLQQWDASRAVELWWTDKSRRINRSAGDSHASTSGNQAAVSKSGDSESHSDSEDGGSSTDQ